MVEHQGRGRTVKYLQVAAEDAGRRLDNFLLSHLRGVPRSRIYRIIRSGEVRVNKGRARPDRRLTEGDQVRIPPVSLPDRHTVRPGRGGWLLERIIYRDTDLLVIDKPAGLAVHGGSGVHGGLIELLRSAMPAEPALELVHRLDRATSGCLMVARRRSALRRLHQDLKERRVGKRYLALVHGQWPRHRRRIQFPLLTRHRSGGERHVIVRDDGKPALTRFQVIGSGTAVTLLRAIPETGRTHQIRVHTAALGHPLVGDQRYGVENDPVASSIGLNRLFLHAQELELTGAGGQRVTVECPPGPDLARPMEELGLLET